LSAPRPIGSRLKISSVIATANTPSLKDSTRRESTAQPPGSAGLFCGRVGAERLVDPLGVDPLADPLLHPHPRPAGPAAEPALLAPVHLLRADTGDPLHDLPGSREDPVVPAEEAGIVIGDLLLDRVRRGELALFDQPGQQLGVMDALVVAPQLRLFIRERVEAVR